MEKLKDIINNLADILKGHNALIQIQVENTYIIRKIGDINKLAERPKVDVLTSDSSFIDWMRVQIQAASVRESTKSNHLNCLKHIVNYQQYIKFSDINLSFLTGFEQYLRAKRLSINTIAKIMKILRKYVNLAMDDDILVTNAFRKYKIKTERKEHPALTENELKRIESVTTNSDEEHRTKDLFLLATYTGLRYSDVSRTKHSQIKKNWLILNQYKTKREVHIPIKTLFKGKAIPLIGVSAPPNSRCNIILKRLCKRAKIRKRVTMHTARRTCATILTARGIPLQIVQNILGHESVRTTESYIQSIDLAVNKAVRKAWK